MKIFIDFHGTLAEFKMCGPDVWMKSGYARTLNPIERVVKAVKILLNEKSFNGEPIELYLCSSVVSLDYAAADEKYWLNCHGIRIPEENMIFMLSGESKAEAIKKAGIEIDPGDIFLDDYTQNLNELSHIKGLVPVKLINGINDTNRTWKGARVSAFSSPREIAFTLLGLSVVAKTSSYGNYCA